MSISTDTIAMPVRVTHISNPPFGPGAGRATRSERSVKRRGGEL